MATQEDRSLSSGMSFPRWMKTKMNDRSDFGQNAFSPTELDDSFMFYYRNNNNNRGSIETPDKILSSTTSSIIQATEQSQQAPSIIVTSSADRPDFSKHTLPCQKYLQNSEDSTKAQEVKFIPSATKTKSSGTDDGFKGEAAKCGSSIIRVAHQMVAGKVIRGFDVMNTSPNDCDCPPPGFNPSIRRGSKSLPASPLSTPPTSPKTTRRLANKYFTGAFVDTENHHGSWILSNLLMSKRQALSQSVGHIAEEDERALQSAASTASVDEAGAGASEGAIKKASVFVAKPSELREMNFWSPTSM